MDWQLFRLNGVCNAYWEEYRYLNHQADSAPYTCTSGSLFWKEGSAVKHLLVDIGFGVWQSVVDFLISAKQTHSEMRISSSELAGILITHQHLDHIGELVPFVESWYRLHERKVPINLYATEAVRDFIATAYPWLLNAKKGKEKLRVNIIRSDEAFLIGKINILPIDSSSHCKGGVNFFIESELAKIFVAWDLNEMPKANIDWHNIDIACFDGNTFEDHPTGHCSIRSLLNWAKEVGLKNMNIVHYSGWEDGLILDLVERKEKVEEMCKEIDCQDLNVVFGQQRQQYMWNREENKRR